VACEKSGWGYAPAPITDSAGLLGYHTLNPANASALIMFPVLYRSER